MFQSSYRYPSFEIVIKNAGDSSSRKAPFALYSQDEKRAHGELLKMLSVS